MNSYRRRQSNDKLTKCNRVWIKGFASHMVCTHYSISCSKENVKAGLEHCCFEIDILLILVGLFSFLCNDLGVDSQMVIRDLGT